MGALSADAVLAWKACEAMGDAVALVQGGGREGATCAWVGERFAQLLDLTEGSSVAELLQRQGVPVQRVEWMVGNTDTARQVLVLTDEAPQGALDLAVHALQALPEVAGPCVQWRVELLEG